MRLLDFSDGFTSESAPFQGTTTTTQLATHASDAAFVTAKGAAAASGDLYFNTTSNKGRVYNGSVWVEIFSYNSDGTLTFNGEATFNDDVTILGNTTLDQDVVISGNLTVNGTTVTLNTTTWEVEDTNITLNNGGDQSTANNTAGITIEMSDATDATIVYDSSKASKWKLGESGSEQEVATVSDTQTFTNKTHTNPILNGTASGTAIQDDDTFASAASNKLASSESIKAYVDAQLAYDPVVTKTTTATLLLTESTVLADATSAAFTINLPTAVGIAGKYYTIKKIDTDYTKTVTIDGAGSETINGATNYTLDISKESVTIYSDGANWQVRVAEIPKTIVEGGGNSGGTLTANVTNITFTEIFDSNNAWNGSVFTAQKTDSYQVIGALYFTGTPSGVIYAYVNGTQGKLSGYVAGVNSNYLYFSWVGRLNKGDTLSWRGQAGYTLVNNPSLHWIQISNA